MQEPTPDATKAAPPHPFRGRVLIVEDDRGLLEAYTEVAKRLGIMMENERPAGSGPVLVKG